MITTVAHSKTLEITWEILPHDFPLEDDPVDNVNQPLLAAALSESLELAGKISEKALTTTNYGICATVNQKIVVKAPDWAYIPEIKVSRSAIQKSYTPHQQGSIPLVVMEFLSDHEGSEYSRQREYPPGKLFFYEQILKVPHYLIFNPETGELERYQLTELGNYQSQAPSENQRYWLSEMDLFIGVWFGTKDKREGYWLRWWDEKGNLLLWGSELVEHERLAREIAQQIAIQERLAKENAEQIAIQERLAKEQERLAKENAEQIAIQERLAKEQERLAKENALKRLAELEKRLRDAGIEP
jgi:Uma2 family endonuclease